LRRIATAADSYPFEHAFLAHTATRIINDRVVDDVTSKSPETIGAKQSPGFLRGKVGY
jgi:GMP synthase PP-ATPase subunit